MKEKANRNFQQNNSYPSTIISNSPKRIRLLYQIAKKERSLVYRKTISSGQKIPPTLLLPVPEEFRKQNHIPSEFRLQLEAIKNPAAILTRES